MQMIKLPHIFRNKKVKINSLTVKYYLRHTKNISKFHSKDVFALLTVPPSIDREANNDIRKLITTAMTCILLFDTGPKSYVVMV